MRSEAKGNADGSGTGVYKKGVWTARKSKYGRGPRALVPTSRLGDGEDADDGGRKERDEIGRASCRERVS